MRREGPGRRRRRDDLVREADLLVDRVRRATRELTSLPSGSPERAAARERLSVLVAELDLATRRWAEVGASGDPRRDPRFDRRLSWLAHRALSTHDQLERARSVLSRLLDEDARRPWRPW